jgi:hypothetical protein
VLCPTAPAAQASCICGAGSDFDVQASKCQNLVSQGQHTAIESLLTGSKGALGYVQGSRGRLLSRQQWGVEVEVEVGVGVKVLRRQLRPLRHQRLRTHLEVLQRRRLRLRYQLRSLLRLPRLRYVNYSINEHCHMNANSLSCRKLLVLARRYIFWAQVGLVLPGC